MEQTHEIKQFVAVRAFIVYEGKVLIIRESKEYIQKRELTVQRYDLPGGKINPGETYQDALVREVKEECGLMIDIGRPFFIDEWRPVVKGSAIQIIGVFIECQAIDTKVMLSPDHDEYKWIEPKEYSKLSFLPPNDKAFEVYLQIIGKNV